MEKIQNGVIYLNTGSVNNMKHIVILFILLFSAFFFTSCATKSQKEEGKQDEKTFTYTPNLNHSFLTEKNVGETISIRGKLIQNDNSFTIIENAASKSRVTFVLEVEDVSLIKQLQELNDKTITLSGELLEASSTWTKKMKVLKVE